jgi:hypothetical protein
MGFAKAQPILRLLAEFDFPSRDIFATIPHKKIIRPQAKAFIDFVQRLMPGSPDRSRWISNDISRKNLDRSPADALDSGWSVSAD